MKTRKGFAKRIRVTKTGKLMRASAWKSHLLEHKSQKRKREYAKQQPVAKADRKEVRRPLGIGGLESSEPSRLMPDTKRSPSAPRLPLGLEPSDALSADLRRLCSPKGGVASCARSVTHPRDALPHVLVGP